MRRLVYALMFSLAMSVAAGAEERKRTHTELRPTQAQTIKLGSVQGVAYYTVEPEGFQVVASILAGETMLRFTSTLRLDQKVVISVPGNAGEGVTQIEFERRGDHLYATEPLLLN